VIDEIVADCVVRVSGESDFNFVPTPSAEATSVGWRIAGNAASNMPPKLPMSVSVRSLKVARASCLMRSFAGSMRLYQRPRRYRKQIYSFTFLALLPRRLQFEILLILRAAPLG
jgi:hypothetical protein